MIRRHDLLYPLTDVIAVFVGCFHQVVELSEKFICVKRDWAADVDQIVLGALQPFFCHQLLLVELLARAKAGVDDLDVLIRFVAGHTDQVAGQGVDLDRCAHVEHEDLAAVCVRACLKDEAPPELS